MIHDLYQDMIQKIIGGHDPGLYLGHDPGHGPVGQDPEYNLGDMIQDVI